jgi:hypothetical protein
MFTLINTIENEVIAELTSESELIEKIKKIILENEDFDFSVLSISNAFEYVEDYCGNLVLFNDNEVGEFLESRGIEVKPNEPMNYVELMMDNHRCIEWKGKQYYVPEDFSSNDEDEFKLHENLVDYCRIF